MTKKHEALVLALIKQELNKNIKTSTGAVLPIGYNPIEQIRGALFSWVVVPFNGSYVWCQLRCPNATQIEQCGDISNIIIDKKSDKEYTHEDVIKIRNYQEALCKIVFNNPTYDHIAQIVGEKDFVLSEKKKELETIKTYFESNKGTMIEAEKHTIATQIRTLELMIGYILPDDTMAFITRWAMGNDVSDIKKLSRETLLRAACLAKAHNKAPTEYISGVFTDYNKQEIDGYAFAILDEFLKQQEIVKGTTKASKYRWFLGGRHKTVGVRD